jgi:hypothetical protein
MKILAPAKYFEYKFYNSGAFSPSKVLQDLNNFGKEGWEICSLENKQYLLKRELKFIEINK